MHAVWKDLCKILASYFIHINREAGKMINPVQRISRWSTLEHGGCKAWRSLHSTRSQVLQPHIDAHPLVSVPLLFPGQDLCVTPKPTPTQVLSLQSDTCMGVAAVSPLACWSMRQFPASGAWWGRERENSGPGTAQLCCSLWYCQGRVMALCSNSHHQTNVVWLWFFFPMHYQHSEKEGDGKKTVKLWRMWEEA